MKLISMTDFVLDKSKNAPIDDYHEVNEKFVNSVISYANFLKQPLSLGMFVPCDDDGNVLEEPQWWHRYNCGATPFMNFDEIRPCQEYQQAKEKVLFNGFEIDYTKEENPTQYLFNNELGLNIFLDKSFGVRHETIEDLAGLDLDCAVSF